MISSAQYWVCGSCCPCRATGIWGCLITLGQSCMSLAAGRSVDSPVWFALAKALSQEGVLQTLPQWIWHFQPLSCQLPTSYSEYLLLLYYPLSISRSLIFPFLQLLNTFILTKCFRITKCWCRRMNNTGREWIFSGSRLLPSNCLLFSLIVFKLFEIAAPNKCY